jgi:Carboxypeptidase regulatory-like domain
MRITVSSFAAVACLLSVPEISPAAELAAVTGKVADASGQPVEHATVMVYEAGVKKGYSEYCPTCWADCGKHASTDAEGNFRIAGLSPDLLFTLLVVRDGYSAEYLKKVDPAQGPAGTAVLKTRAPIEDPAQLVRGLVVDAHGRPLRDAVVEQQGITYRGPGGGTGSRFGPLDWIDQMAVTNEKGEFEMAYGKPAVQMILQVSARGMASKLFTEPTGADRQTLTVTDGATIRGRLVANGRPVGNAEIGLITHERRSGTMYSEIRIGTKEDGTFAITNVPAGRIWLLYPKMESLAARGIGADVVACETKDDGQEVDVGDVRLAPAYTLRGKVVLTDGKPIPPDMHVTLSADRGWDSQMAVIGSDGWFEFHGLPSGVYSLGPAVKGYHAGDSFGVEALVNRDIDGLVIRMSPGSGRP